MNNIKTTTAAEFLSETIKEIAIDRAFQRKVCWSKTQQRNYIASFFMKRTPYPIILAEIKSGIKQSIKSCDKTSEEKYLKLKQKGENITYVSLDGQQRSEALRSFINNEITVCGAFVGADRKEYTINNKFYKDLPTRLKDAFDDTIIHIYEMKNCLYSDLHEIFVNINDGEPLNRQEKRNAKMTWFSDYIRDFSETEKNKKLLLRIDGFSEEKILRSLDAEWYSRLYCSILRPNIHHLNHSGIDNFYNLGVNRDRSFVDEYSPSNINRFKSIVSIIYNSVFSKSSKGTKISQRLFWALAIAADDVFNANKTIESYSEFFNAVNDADRALCTETELEYANSNKDYVNGEIEFEPKKSQYYFHWASDINQPAVRAKRREKLIEKLKNSKEYKNSFIKIAA